MAARPSTCSRNASDGGNDDALALFLFDLLYLNTALVVEAVALQVGTGLPEARLAVVIGPQLPIDERITPCVSAGE